MGRVFDDQLGHGRDYYAQLITIRSIAHYTLALHLVSDGALFVFGATQYEKSRPQIGRL